MITWENVMFSNGLQNQSRLGLCWYFLLPLFLSFFLLSFVLSLTREAPSQNLVCSEVTRQDFTGIGRPAAAAVQEERGVSLLCSLSPGASLPRDAKRSRPADRFQFKDSISTDPPVIELKDYRVEDAAGEARRDLKLNRSGSLSLFLSFPSLAEFFPKRRNSRPLTSHRSTTRTPLIEL